MLSMQLFDLARSCRTLEMWAVFCFPVFLLSLMDCLSPLKASSIEGKAVFNSLRWVSTLCITSVMHECVQMPTCICIQSTGKHAETNPIHSHWSPEARGGETRPQLSPVLMDAHILKVTWVIGCFKAGEEVAPFSRIFWTKWRRRNW